MQPNIDYITPIEKHDSYWIKRDDMFCIAGMYGGKVRTCWNLAQGATGLVTAGSRQSPQANIVAHIANYLNIPSRIHTPTGELSAELKAAQKVGAQIIQHKAGYNNVIISRAKKDALETGYREIPFGMECQEAIIQTSKQVHNLPKEIKRIIIPVGSGMSLAGLLTGLSSISESNIPVIGIQVGADPIKRLNKYAPFGWQLQCKIIKSNLDYHKEANIYNINNLILDPIYEAKCIPFLEPNDLFWVVGIRQTIVAKQMF